MLTIKKHFFTVLAMAIHLFAIAQTTDLKLDDLNLFLNPSANWAVVGDVNMDISKPQDYSSTAGKGVLLNKAGESAKDLITNFEHGDMDMELEFMMAKNSNSGIYLMGNYEIQLADSWGKTKITGSDCGGIYERWDESKPEGQKGFLGIAPRENACKAPGLWQKLRISFDAPRFENGKKTANARINYVYLNEVLIHENVELLGQTRGSLSPEKPTGVLRFQGDHGPVAFRKVTYKNYSKEKISWDAPLTYKYYEQAFGDRFNTWDFKPKKTGTTELITWQLADLTNNFALSFEGNIKVKNAGKYLFELTQNGIVQLVVNGDTIVKNKFANISEKRLSGTGLLKEGNNKISISYWKTASWSSPLIGLYISGQGIKRTPLHEFNSQPPFPKLPAMAVDAEKEAKVSRTFMRDIKGKNRTHAASIGFPVKLNASIDLQCNALLQIWKGGFLDMVNAWNGRGGDPVEPLGGPLLKFNPVPSIASLANANTAWPDSLSTEEKKTFKLINYAFDEQGIPHFNYKKGNLAIEEIFAPEDNNKILGRTLKVKSAEISNNLYCLVAQSSKIVLQKDGWYMIGDKEYMIKLKSTNSKPILREVNNMKELLLPFQFADGSSQVSYSFIW